MNALSMKQGLSLNTILMALAVFAIVSLMTIGAAYAGADGTFNTALTTFTDFLEGSGGKIITIISLALGLAGMAKAFEEQRAAPDLAALSFEERVGIMADREAAERRIVHVLHTAPDARQDVVTHDVGHGQCYPHLVRGVCDQRQIPECQQHVEARRIIVVRRDHAAVRTIDGRWEERGGDDLLEEVRIDVLLPDERVDREISVSGPDLARSLTDLRLIDEYRLYFHPVVLGQGKPFFAGPRPPLRLVASDRIGENAIRLAYVPV